MIKRLMRFRVLKEPLIVDGISLPQGDYDGEISWSELPCMGHPIRVRQSWRPPDSQLPTGYRAST